MHRFAIMLENALPDYGYIVKTLRPPAIFARLHPTAGSIGKWLGYIDKYIIFPIILRARSKAYDVVHICDHSNAMYLPHISKKSRSVVTCHDMLAIRGALGEDTDCPASWAGKTLQRWILANLGKADVAACVSSYTMSDVRRLVKGKPGFQAMLALNGLNHSYRVLPSEEALKRLKEIEALDPKRPYILHVGSNLRRKNREGIIRSFCKTRNKWQGLLVFAGQPLTPALRELVESCGLNERVVEVINPSNRQLEALYNSAHAFFFPSRHEGFGWPIIEAQASGCPVICSMSEPFKEVAGDAAMTREVDDEEGFAEDILNLQNHELREDIIQKGLENVKRFTANKMVLAYHLIYTELLNSNT